jgi:hypothetical protein
MQLTEQQRAVLALVAADVGVPADQFWIDERGAVFFNGDEGMRCACVVGTPYWIELSARAETTALFSRLGVNFSG